MRPIQSIGPSLVVLATAVVVLAFGPSAVRALTHARTEVRIEQASNRLGDRNVLELFNEASRDIATIVEPSVVHVSTEALVTDRSGGSASVTSSGSGWVYDDDGHIVSNAHVVDGATTIQVQLYTGERFNAEIIGIDLRSDIAVLKIRAGQLIPARRGSSDDVDQGEMVFAFGSPFDFRFSMSSGIVSGLGRSAGFADIDYEDFIQVDAAINPGNSGGPLTDVTGRVIGMNTAIATGRGNTPGQGLFAGIGLAIPMSMIESVVDQLIEKGEVDKGFMGVQVTELTPFFARELAYNGNGALIRVVTPGGPAERAGLIERDVITHIDGRPVHSRRLIPAIVASHRPGDDIAFRIWRSDPTTGGVAMEITVTLDKLDPAATARGASRVSRDFGLVDLATSNPVRAARFGVEHTRGVLVQELRPGSVADQVLQPGTVIVALGGQAISNVEEYYTRLERQIQQILERGALGTIVLRVVAPTGREQDIRMPMQLPIRPG